MSESVLIAIISAAGALIVGMTSVCLNIFWMGRSFDQQARSTDGRFDQLTKSIDRIDRRLDRMEGDMKEFYGILSEHSTEITRLKDRTDLK